MTRSIAIVGAGPGGFYVAEALLATLDDCRIDILDRLPTPFGLVRGGIAPDHQGTKKVAKVLERTARHANVRFLGNVEMGRDVSLAELRHIYDAVVLSYGAPADRRLDIPGADKRGVIGSNAFVGWYNCHPDFRTLDPDLDVAAVAVVGVGNVALDVARLLAKTVEERADTDMAEYAEQRFARSPVTDIYLFGRRGPIEAAFTKAELRELGGLARAVPLVDPAQLPDHIGDGDFTPKERKTKEANLDLLRGFSRNQPGDKPVRIHICFYAQPVAVLGGDRVAGLRLERTRVVDGRAVGTGETFDVACGLVFTCIGSRAEALEGVPFDEGRGVVRQTEGEVEPGLYAAGWLKRGPVGKVATNRDDSHAVAARIVADLKSPSKPGPAALDALLGGRGVRAVSYDDWLKINAAEEAAATGKRPRRKFVAIADMLAVLDRQ